jgi:hypothetical protein
MQKRFQHVAVVVLACLCLAGLAVAQDSNYSVDQPRFLRLPPHGQQTSAPAGNLVQWNGSFKDNHGATRTFTMVGTDPTNTNTSTVIPVYIIPIKMVYGPSNGNMTFDPMTKLSNGQTIVANAATSPIINHGVNFTQGGVNLGTTQYLDAYQRANWWSTVQNEPNYHVLLSKPRVLPVQTINVTPSQGSVGSHFGKTVGTMDLFAFDNFLQGYITKFKQIQPNTLPIFLTYDIYLTEGGCCVGGYHSANGRQPTGQTYSYTTWVDQGTGVFSQDVAAFSHEIGEWMDDPFVDNFVGCQDNSILENGDPLVLHDYAYTLHGFTYHLQSLVFMGYFGAPKTLSLNSWLSFQNDETHVCPGQ